MPAINYGAALEDAASSDPAGMMFGLPGGGLIGFAVVPGLLPHLFGKNSTQMRRPRSAMLGRRSPPIRAIKPQRQPGDHKARSRRAGCSDLPDCGLTITWGFASSFRWWI
jgi:hypothetical protein